MSDITPNIPSSLIEKEELKTKGRILDYIQLSNEYIDIISQILHEIINENAALVNKREEENSIIKGFISKKPPHISVKNYLKRLMKYTKPEPSTVIISLIFIDKVCENSNVQLTNLNIHR
jgi:6-pyruvoyl-tetrahydropterin synthase